MCCFRVGVATGKQLYNEAGTEFPGRQKKLYVA
jgi:hypothetical protein